MTSLAIGPNCQVTMHFALKLADGAVVDSTFDKQPVTFVVGDGNLPENFEQTIFGLQAGDYKELVLTPEYAFGMPNPNNIQRIARKSFASDMELSPGLVLSFADANKAELPGVVKSFDDKMVEIDFNHPLAGQTLNFEVKVIAVEPANEVNQVIDQEGR
ncbi:FKBP-type peptidyl-prolyl cis-trans isomerase [Endozoicomonas sp. SM1973]|uniref:Peptidyl-prolyl cis-trans isomerase n=1 Tax=Spartinivicinus marinus TaxID=2994442 RepID=A0A853I6I0_9GAMM|nr:FKBP-type peptidyl-prolyl cis-trans isomerase [Spartinivicinus marinus]MCX4025594.1 FKBP-type peptidyl-prolyl cis-trans isomerase [Spartinivicinus marinus]NYZ65177.1 FKBP-type peptidyl-prolyl cis-trans isomerase [Spartinivicinus marinus]